MVWLIKARTMNINVQRAVAVVSYLMTTTMKKYYTVSRKIVAVRFGKIEKRGGHHDANRVVTNVLASSVAAAVPIKPYHGCD